MGNLSSDSLFSIYRALIIEIVCDLVFLGSLEVVLVAMATLMLLDRFYM